MAKAGYFNEVKMRGGCGAGGLGKIAASLVSCSGRSVITGSRLLWDPGSLISLLWERI